MKPVCTHMWIQAMREKKTDRVGKLKTDIEKCFFGLQPSAISFPSRHHRPRLSLTQPIYQICGDDGSVTPRQSCRLFKQRLIAFDPSPIDREKCERRESSKIKKYEMNKNTEKRRVCVRERGEVSEWIMKKVKIRENVL